MIFLKFHHSLLRMPKIIEISWIVPVKKRDKKTHTIIAHIRRRRIPLITGMQDTPKPHNTVPYRR